MKAIRAPAERMSAPVQSVNREIVILCAGGARDISRWRQPPGLWQPNARALKGRGTANSEINIGKRICRPCRGYITFATTFPVAGATG
jgi:hypothetical protein